MPWVDYMERHLEQGAERTWSAILMRAAIYSGQEVTLNELINSNEALQPHIDLRSLA